MLMTVSPRFPETIIYMFQILRKSRSLVRDSTLPCADASTSLHIFLSVNCSTARAVFLTALAGDDIIVMLWSCFACPHISCLSLRYVLQVGPLTRQQAIKTQCLAVVWPPII